MPALKNLKHDLFAQSFAVSGNATQAYAMAGFSGTGHGAEVNACKLLKKAEVQARVAELRAKVEAKLPQFDIRKVEDRVKAAQNRWNRMRQAEEVADYSRVAPDALGRLMLATEEQAAIEMGQREHAQPAGQSTVIQLISLPSMSMAQVQPALGPGDVVECQVVEDENDA